MQQQVKVRFLHSYMNERTRSKFDAKSDLGRASFLSNWRDRPKQTTIQGETQFKKSDPDLGFRANRSRNRGLVWKLQFLITGLWCS